MYAAAVCAHKRRQTDGTEKITISTQRVAGSSIYTLPVTRRRRQTRALVIRCAHVSRRRCLATRAHPVRFHDQLSFHFPRFLDRAREFSRGTRRAVAEDRQGRLSRSLQVLAEDLRRGVRHGRGVGHRDVLPVRHQLGGVLGSGRPGDRSADGLRGIDGLLPRSGLPRRDAVRHEEGGQASAFLRHAHGRHRHLHLGVLDTQRQQLDADARRLRHQRRGPVRARRGLAAHHLQPELSVSPGAHGDRGVSDHRAGGGRGGRVAPAARLAARARSQDVFHGHVDGGAGRAGADFRGRSAWPEHARAPARESHGDGRALPEPRRRRASHPVRHSGR